MNNNVISIYPTIIKNELENKIKNNEFKTKEEIKEVIEDLLKRGIPKEFLNEEKQKELFKLFDDLHSTETISMDMSNYKEEKLVDKKYIIGTKEDKVLKNQNGNINEEFNKIQDELLATTSQKNVTSNMVFENMANTKKEEVEHLTLNEVEKRLDSNSIKPETWKKINFFLKNFSGIEDKSKNIEISLEDELFYDTEEDSIYEVRKNETTGEYEIYKASELIYGETTETIENEEEVEEEKDVIKDSEEEEMSTLDIFKESYNQTYNALTKPKVRTLKKQPYDMNNAAFAKSSLIIVLSIIIAMAVATILLNFAK